MSSGRIEPLFRSTSFRVSLIHALLLAGALAGAAAGTFVATSGVAEGELRDRMLLESHAIARAIESGGLDAGAAAVIARAERTGALEYRLTDAQGRLVAGDLPVLDARQGWSVVRLPEGAPGAEGRERLLVLTEAMPDGSHLTVGDDLDRVERVRNAVLATLAWIAGLALVMSLAAGLLLTRRILGRLEAVVATVSAFAHGDLDARAPMRDGAQDDIDQHASGVNAMLDRIAYLVASLRRVSADIAHDLRTPLAQARQKLEAATTAQDGHARDAAIASAGAKIDQALRTFNAMLRLAEIEAGAARARFASIDLSETAELVADAYRLDIEGSGRSFRFGPLEFGHIEGDEDLVGQAVANLIENALRHTPQGATIRLTVKADEEHMRLIIVDDGPGIPASRHAETLEPFSRLDESRTTPGSGLGLPIVAAIARLHHANLTLEDARPGLRVSLEFPRTAARAAPAARS